MTTYVRDLVSERGTFTQLPSGMSLQLARLGLQVIDGAVAVVMGRAGQPLTVVTAADLAALDAPEDTPLVDLAAELPPGLTIFAAMTLADLVASPAFVALNAGVGGAIVFEGPEWRGILTRDALCRHLEKQAQSSRELAESATLASASAALAGAPAALAGDIITPPIEVFCTDFQHRNVLEYWPEKSPDCVSASPHTHPIWHEVPRCSALS